MSSSSNTRIANNTVILYIRMAIILVVNLYTTRVILQNLGADDYGIYNLVYGFVIMFSVLNVTLTVGINRYYNFELGQKSLDGVRRVYNVALRIQTICAVLILLILEPIGVWYVNNYMVMDVTRVGAANWVFQLAVTSLIFIILQNPYSSAVLAFERMDYYAVVSVVDAILKMLVALGISYTSSDRLICFSVGMTLISIIDFGAYYIYCKTKFSDCIRLSKKCDRKTFKDMLSFSGWMILDPVAYGINGQGVNMLINSFFGTLVNTAFGIANQVGQAIDSFCMNLSTAFRPQLVQSYSSGDHARSAKLFASMSKMSFYLFLLICIPFILNIRYIFDLWLGDTYPSIAITITVLFVLVKLVGCINHPISYIIMAKGKMKTYMIITSVITSSIFPIAYVILKLGASVEIVFVAMIIVAVVNQLASIFILSREIPEISQSLYYKEVLFPCITLFVMVFLLVYLAHQMFNNNLLRLLIDGFTSCAATLVLAYFLFMNKAEKEVFTSLINKRLHK